MHSLTIHRLARWGLLCFWLFTPSVAGAQSNSPEELARSIVQAFAADDAAAFARLCPHKDAVGLVEYAIKQRFPRRTGTARVVWGNEQRAVLLLSGYPVVGNSGDETIYSRNLSGFYEASRDPSGWKVTKRIPIDEGNRILSQKLDVEIAPGQGLKVRDVLMLRVRSRYGFAAFLNHRAQFSQVRLNGRPIDAEFRGGP